MSKRLIYTEPELQDLSYILEYYYLGYNRAKKNNISPNPYEAAINLFDSLYVYGFINNKQVDNMLDNLNRYVKEKLEEDDEQTHKKINISSITSNLRKSLKATTNTRNPLNREIMKGGLTNE